MSGTIHKSTWVITYTVYYEEGTEYQSTECFQSFSIADALEVLKTEYSHGDVVVGGLWGPFLN